MLKCKECKYETKKEATLKKCMVTNHEDHECKEFNRMLSSFMELMKTGTGWWWCQREVQGQQKRL